MIYMKKIKKMKHFTLVFILGICITTSVKAQFECTPVCNNLVYVSVDPNGPTEITADMILEGSYANCINFTPTVSLEDFNTNTPLANSPFIDANNIGQDILAIVTDQSTGNSCWGQITVDDPSACHLFCKPTVQIYMDDSQGLIEIKPEMVDAGSTCANSNLIVEVYNTNSGLLTDDSPFVSPAEVGVNLNAKLIDVASGESCTSSLIVTTCLEGIDLEIRQTGSGNEVQVDLIVENFLDIAGFQFSLNYDGSVLKFDDVSVEHENLGSGVQFNGNLNNAIGFSWTDGTVMGVDIPDGESLMTLKFKTIMEGDSEMLISGDPVLIEFINDKLDVLCLNSEPTAIVNSGSHVTGKIYKDKNGDCALDPNLDTVVENWLIKLDDGANSFYGSTNASGNYLIFAPPGDYTLTAIGPNALWGFCTNDFSVSLIDENTIINQDFISDALVDCSSMRVNISTPFLRRCFDNYYSLKYCNEGTITATDAYVEVSLDDDMDFVSSAHPNYNVTGQTIIFNLGDVEEGDCGTINFTANLRCNTTILGQTHCVEARIFPNEPCETDPLWTGASIEIEGTCENDNAKFRIINTGIGDMAGPLEFIVIEDDVMRPATTFQLNAYETLDLNYPADGTSYRLLAEQEPNHPGYDNPSLAMEGCVNDPTLAFSMGFVNMFSNNDMDPYVDIDCQESIGSYDPNDKRASPKGYGEEAYIKANTRLDYKIRFQNTGTDTAFNVLVRDQINPEFDLSTLKLGTSSHPFSFEIEEGNVLAFSFEDINLVDSTKNEPLSHGFVQFSIDQIPDHQDGILLLNDAEIFFDFNDTVITNTSKHIVGSEFIEISTRVIDLENISLKIYPNPAAKELYLEFDYKETDVLIEIANQFGQILKSQNVNSGERIVIESFAAGMYHYRLVTKDNILAIGQFTKS